MAPRQQLQALLKTLCPNVYFQPPADISMIYPCIVYERSRGTTAFADNVPYHHQKQYIIKAISRNPDDILHDKLVALPQTVHDRSYVVDNLNHNVFSIFF